MGDEASLLRVGCAPMALALVAVTCSGDDDQEPSAAEEAAPTDIAVRSSAFSEGSSIPMKYTCDREDLSPPLAWNSASNGTRSLALISDDPDAGDSASGSSKVGMGLLRMRESAELLGGSLSMQSSAETGCHVVLHIPSKNA